ncbi:MAG: hypothetical protein RL755_2100 [Pseudomonadota bacterium]
MSNSKLIVVKHNSIIEAGYELSVFEHRVLLVCIAQIDSMKALSVNDEFEVSATDIADLVNTKSHAIYDYLDESVKRLAERWLVIETPNEKIKQSKIRWISQIDYLNQAGTIRLTFSKGILPYLSELRRDFTKYRLSNVMNFKSMYSSRIYEILARWGGGEKVLEVSWLKEKLQLTDKYARISSFKHDVIDIAIKEINSYSNMRVRYEQIKQGRNVIAFKFIYVISPSKKQSQQQQKYSSFLNVKEENDDLENLESSKEMAKQKKNFGKLNKNQSNNHIDNIEYFADMRKKYGDAVSSAIPTDVIELLKSQGRW